MLQEPEATSRDMRRAFALLLVFALAGCLSATPPSSQPEQPQEPSVPAIINNGAVRMDVPVPVFLIGFSDELAAQLQARLQPSSFGRPSFTPTAVYEVYTPNATWQDDFDGFLAGADHAGNALATGFAGPVLDGNAIEERLAATLAQIHDVPDGITSLVVLNTGRTGHAYHYEGNVGWREPVRAFGERHAFLVWDPFAEADPWAGTAIPHQSPVAAATADHLAAWVERATAIRALHMPIWPPTTLTCHAITIVFGVRSTTVTPSALGLQSWQEAFDVERLQATFENLTGDPVFVDLNVLHLPQDDPALEATTRENGARAVTQTYLDMNFDAYHVGHEGCEAYLSLVVYGDLADQRTQSNGNAVMMSASGNRISTSLVAENVRVMSEAIGYNDVWDESTTFERVGPGADPHEWFNWIVAHETGHLFSLPHPNYSTGQPSYSDTGFASTWNVMGYQMRRIVTDTSFVDTNNFQRHQAAYAVLAADARGMDVTEALDLMGQYRWKEATLLSQ